MIENERTLKGWRWEIIYGWKLKTSIQIDLWRSLTTRDTDPLGSWRRLVKECFSSNFQKDGWYMMYSMKTCWQGAENPIIKDNIWNQYLNLWLLMKKRNTKLKKFRNIENMEERHNTWYIGKVMGMNIINRSQKWGCLIQKKQ